MHNNRLEYICNNLNYTLLTHERLQAFKIKLVN